MNIFLIGFMGAGKSTVGKALAHRLDLHFLDTDELIEIKTGMSIKNIFARFGEKFFRNLEREVIDEISRKDDNLIVAVILNVPFEATFTLLPICFPFT